MPVWRWHDTCHFKGAEFTHSNRKSGGNGDVMLVAKDWNTYLNDEKPDNCGSEIGSPT